MKIGLYLVLGIIAFSVCPFPTHAGKSHRYSIDFCSFSRDRHWEVDKVQTTQGFTAFTDPMTGQDMIITGPIIITDRGK